MSEQEKQTRVIQSYEQPIEIDLTRSAKGAYYWKISVKAESPLSALRMIQDIDAELRHRFAEAPGSTPGPSPSAPAISQDPLARMDQQLRNIKAAGEKLLKRQGEGVE